ncbi:hypothetical protein F4818DRAFT_282432 [Hypoxylon cercidicola]|nr:hypothetical protein F4818DRAFT_282432 [Hypoxylon cercidicola]
MSYVVAFVGLVGLLCSTHYRTELSLPYLHQLTSTATSTSSVYARVLISLLGLASRLLFSSSFHSISITRRRS